MTQVYDSDNNLVPVTIIEAGPCPVLQVKTLDKDGYSAIQIGYNPKGKSPNKANKCAKGHAAKAGVDAQQVAQEIRLSDDHDFERGNTLTVDHFKDVKMIDVVSKTKGRGFQGVVKRWNFAGGRPLMDRCFIVEVAPMVSVSGLGVFSRIRKMPGHMGDASRTTQNLAVVKILADKNLILVKGSVPGHKGSIITLRVAKKSKNPS